MYDASIYVLMNRNGAYVYKIFILYYLLRLLGVYLDLVHAVFLYLLRCMVLGMSYAILLLKYFHVVNAAPLRFVLRTKIKKGS